MDVNIRDKWADALESGEYDQGKGILRSSEDQFCCLGVLCDVLAKEGKGSWEHPEEDVHVNLFHVNGGRSHETELFWSYGMDLPFNPKALGLSELEGLDETLHSELIDGNDNLDLTFDQIAQIVRNVL